MPRRYFTAEQFVNAVHRRLVVIRVLEEIGRGFFLAAILAIVLNGIAVWQSMPTRPVLFLCLTLALLIGIGLAVIRWPTRMSTVAEADLQLQMDDLLSTALLSAITIQDDFSRVVIAMADARCALHSPSEVLLRRIGLRRWSGMGLMVTIAITLALFPFNAAKSRADDSGLSALSQDSSEWSGQDRSTLLQQPSAQNNDPSSENSSGKSPATESKTDNDNGKNPTSRSDPKSGRSSGTGGGKSATDERFKHESISDTSSSHSSVRDGTIAGGGNSSRNASEQGESISGMTSGQSSDINPAWNGGGDSDSTSSIQNLNDRVPPEDRDLVQKFFAHK